MAVKNIKFFYLSGGFGNLMFQYIGFKHILEIGGPNLSLKVSDLLIKRSWLTKYILRWKVHENYAELLFQNELNSESNVKLTNILELSFLLLSKMLNRSFCFYRYQFTEDIAIKLESRAYMGYFQNIDMYKDNWAMYVNSLQNKLGIGNPKDRLVVHMRFGDSVWAQDHSNYYNEVSKYLIAFKGKVDFISDDHSLCSNFASKLNLNFSIYKASMLEEFIYFAESERCICAPSTFSWWGAQFNMEKKKLIIMPYFFYDRFGSRDNNTVYF